MSRVIVADDHKIFREGLVELLSGERSIEVAGTASDGADALSKTNALAPEILILDISMPILDGFEVTKALRQRGTDVKILMLSMHNDPVSVKKAMNMGVDGYVLKEEAFETLITAIEQVSQGNRFISKGARASLGSKHVEEAGSVLSPRELEIVKYVAEGLTNKEIAAKLGISVKTVETHRQRVMEKLGFHKAAELVRYAFENGILD
ncbi:response regulator transcription factor [bacterium]|nr:MAG: response regulator transcription factor [bacterium]